MKRTLITKKPVIRTNFKFKIGDRVVDKDNLKGTVTEIDPDIKYKPYTYQGDNGRTYYGYEGDLKLIIHSKKKVS